MTCDLEANLCRIRASVSHAACQTGRSADSVTLIAASKTVDSERLQEAIAFGQRVFGENRVQEAKRKWPQLRHDNPGIELHLIGPLQTNKARDAVQIFDVIQSVDRIGLAAEIARESDRQARRPKIYVQVNTANEQQKGGISACDAPKLLKECREVLDIDIRGLMCIPPAGMDPTEDFALLRMIARDHGVERLSMGMSSDYLKAIACGATDIRVGTAIFGSRSTVLQ